MNQAKKNPIYIKPTELELVKLEKVKSNTYDLVLTDIMMPFASGIEILSAIKSMGKDVPVIMLSSMGQEEVVLNAFDLGASDFIVKPFKFGELDARVNALYRRSHQETEKIDTIVIGDLEINGRAKSVKRGADSIILTAKEFKLLYYLAKNMGRIVSRDQILDNVWDINFDMNTNVVDVYITYLRRKIDKPYSSKLIHTMKGLGYVIKP